MTEVLHYLSGYAPAPLTVDRLQVGEDSADDMRAPASKDPSVVLMKCYENNVATNYASIEILFLLLHIIVSNNVIVKVRVIVIFTALGSSVGIHT